MSSLISSRAPSSGSDKVGKRLLGKVAVVTGGSVGIGFVAANLFAQHGAYVYITGRREKELKKAVSAIELQLKEEEEDGEGVGVGGVRGVVGDVSSLSALDELYEVVKKEKGGIDILFANAAVVVVAPFANTTEADFDKLFNINVKGLFFSVQKSLPLLKRGASIIINSSVAGLRGTSGLGAYSSTKAAVRNLARTLAIELADQGVRINVVSPGTTQTDMLNEVPAEAREKLIQQVPMKRIGDPIEIAKPVLFLASDDSSYVTGAEFIVDGGLIA